MKKSNKNEFIKKSKEIHGDKYDYSLVDYINSKTKVKIICKEHGIFVQTPRSHVTGSGCPLCDKSNIIFNKRKIINNIKYIEK